MARAATAATQASTAAAPAAHRELLQTVNVPTKPARWSGFSENGVVCILKDARNLGSSIFAKLVLWKPKSLYFIYANYTRKVFPNIANTLEAPFTGVVTSWLQFCARCVNICCDTSMFINCSGLY